MSTQNIRIEGTAHNALTKLSSAAIAAVTAGKCLIWRAIAEVIWHRALRAAEAELMALDDRMLMDIGLERREIGAVLRGATEGSFRRRPFDLLPGAPAPAKRGKTVGM